MILAIETSSTVVSAALVARDGTGVERSASAGAEELHPLIEAALAAASRSLRDVESIAVDIGPGLFTGLRVGVVAAKCFAVALGVPLVTCTSTDALLEGTTEEPAWAVVDMRRGEVAYARRGEAPVLANPEACARAIAGAPGADGGVVVGDGASRYGEVFAGPCGRRARAVRATLPSALSVGRLGVGELAAGRRADPDTLVPVYLRPPDATANFRARAGEAGRP